MMGEETEEASKDSLEYRLFAGSEGGAAGANPGHGAFFDVSLRFVCVEEKDGVEARRKAVLSEILHQLFSKESAHLRTRVVCDESQLYEVGGL
jgi:hypothetical protein